MNLLHFMDAANVGRPTMELDLRARRVVQALGLSERPLTIVAVGQRLGISPSTMTGLADRLEQQGYVSRRAHESDRRATVLDLTRRGRNLFSDELDFYGRLIDEALASLEERERGLILAALERLPQPERRGAADQAGV